MAWVKSFRVAADQSRQTMSHMYVEVYSITLRELFSGSYVFHLPWFQRTYAWQTKQISRLLGDLFEALSDPGKTDGYFLGTLLICKPGDSRQTSLIDGHQRTMTLTILFSVLRDLCTDAALRDELAGFVRGSDFHLQPQDAQAQFCAQFVQRDGATAEQPDVLFDSLSFTERNILTCRDFIRERLSAKELTAADLSRLFLFLADRCHVIIHNAATEEEGWERLKKEEETRLEFTSVDLAKDNLLSLVPATERSQCASIWEQAHDLIGAADLYGLLCHLRTLKVKRSRNKPMEEEIAEAFRINTDALEFMQKVVLPAAQNLRALRHGEVGPDADQKRIAELCNYMCWIDTQSWLPPALTWLRQHGLNHRDSKEFFARLERLYWMINITPEAREKLAARMKLVATQITPDNSLDGISALVVDQKLKAAVLEKLRAKHFDRRLHRAETMRRIAAADGEDPGLIDRDHVTLEHILPQSAKIKNDWRKTFPNRDHVIANAHRLGNLTYLSGPDNALADSQDFEAKKKVYVNSNFKWTRAVSESKSWLPKDIDERTERLISVLFADWDLPVS